MESTQPTTQPRIPVDKLVLGVVLIVLGVAGFLGTIDVLEFRNVWRLWPLLLIVIGLGNEVEAIRNRRGNNGWILIAIGTWFLIGNFDLFGLSHRQAFPVVIVIAGASMALHALIDRPRATKENDHE